jgi:hypothetical protein
MPIDVNYDVAGRTFIPQVLTHQKFRQNGYLVGEASGIYYIVIDPGRHVMHVWQEDSSGYVQTAKSLGACGFSNGPMMEPMNARVTAWSIAGGTIAGAGAGVAATWYWSLTGPWGVVVVIGGAVVGAGAGFAGAAAAGVVNARPYNVVKGNKHSIDDAGMGHNGELAWFGRRVATDFAAYGMKQGKDFGDHNEEVLAGLVPIIMNFTPNSTTENAINYNSQYAKLVNAIGGVVWSLVPLNAATSGIQLPPSDPEFGDWTRGPLTAADLSGVDLTMPGATAPLTGVVVVMGKDFLGFAKDAARRLLSIGGRDAVAMDGSNSAMLGSFAELLPIYGGASGEPGFGRDTIQRYGIYFT